MQAFLEGSGEIGFEGQKRGEVYSWVNQTLRQQGYEGLNRTGGGGVGGERGGRGFLWRSVTGCGKAVPTASGVSNTRQPGRRRWRSASAGNRSRGGAPDTYASTPCIRATRMGSRACITSTPYTR